MNDLERQTFNNAKARMKRAYMYKRDGDHYGYVSCSIGARYLCAQISFDPYELSQMVWEEMGDDP